MLDGLYEHSPWIAEAALAQRPFASLAQLKHALVDGAARGRPRRAAGADPRPPRARRQGDGRRSRSPPSRRTSRPRPGLTNCSPEEFARIQQLNADYNAKFGWPFILAVRGPRGTRPARAPRSSSTFARRLDSHPDFELAECLRNIHRIAEIRLNDKFGVEPVLGNQVWDWAELLGAAQRPRLRRAGPAHRHLPHRGAPGLPRAAAALDARLRLRRGRASTRSATSSASTTAATRTRKRLLTGSHYDTVRNGGKYDGRLGIFVPHGLRARAAPRRPPPALRLRGGRLRRRRRPALQGHLPRLGRADRPLRPGLAGPARRRRHHDARGDARRRPAGHAGRDRAR